MTIKLRFTLLVSLLLVGFLLATWVLRTLERSEMDAMLAAERLERTQFLNHWIDLAGRALPQFASDTAQSDELVTALGQASSPVIRRQLENALASADLSALWLLRADGSVLLHVAAGADAVDSALPLDAADFAAAVAETPNAHFFAEAKSDLLELAVRRTPAAQKAGGEWLVVARRWDERQLRGLANLTNAHVALQQGFAQVRRKAYDASIELLRPLNDWRGRPVRVLQVVSQATDVEQAINADWRRVRLFTLFGVLVITAFALALRQWVIRPLEQITRSLATSDAAIAARVAGESSEFGRVGRLVVDSFAHRETLQREIAERSRAQDALERSEAALRRNLEERARLGRDLHDGIIQSLYAAGMGLAGIRALLKPDDTEAVARLEQTRAALNETIHDVRNFIVGLEPEALKLQTFAQAVLALLEVMRSLRDFRSTVEIDEAVAERLTLAQRVHALQITREAVSNALRHGQANQIRVALRARAQDVEFEVVDDGIGFDASTASLGGNGLGNFAQRARELGAELRVESRPGYGTSVRLVFSLLII